MAMTPKIMRFVALFFLAVAILFQFFIILSGTKAGNPTNKVYFLEASTSSSGLLNPTRWTYWSICGAEGSKNVNCGSAHTLTTFDPPSNFAGNVTNVEKNIPAAFNNTHKYYYESRWMWAFYLVAIILSGLTFLASGLAFFSRLLSWLDSSIIFLAFAFQAVGAALMTVWAVKGRNIFRNNGQDSHVGSYGFGFAWGAALALFLSMIFFFLGGFTFASRKRRAPLEHENYPVTATA